MRIRIAFMGRGYHLANRLPDELQLDDSAEVGDLIRQVQSHLTDGEHLPTSCLISVAGEHLGTVAKFRDRPLRDGDELVLIAPVAGG